MKRKLLITGLILLILSLGFVRDSIFVSLNTLIQSGQDTSGKITLLKWVLTFVFCGLYLVNTCALLLAVFQNRKYAFIAAGTYLLLLSVAGIAGGAGSLLFSFEKSYSFIRTIMGIAQSPLVAMIVLAGGIINDRIQAGNNPEKM